MRRIAAMGAAWGLLLVLAACSSTSTHSAHRSTSTTLPAVTTTSTTTTTLPSAVPTTVPTPVVPTVGWSSPATTLPPAGGYTSLSCISEVFCLTTGGGSNQADATGSLGPGGTASWTGAVWSAPATYFAAAPGPDSPPWLPAISCTDGPLCAVVDGSAHTTLGDGTTWSPPDPLHGGPAPPANPADPGPGHAGSRTAAVSCAGPHFCAYVDNTGHVATMHGTTWSGLRAIATPSGSSSVALFQRGRVGLGCASPSACTAMVANTVLDWDGTGWSTSSGPWGGDGYGGDTAVSCPGARTCVAVHGSSVSIRLGGTAWSAPRSVDANGRLDAISCPTAFTCVAADAYGAVVRQYAGGWTSPQKVVPTPVDYTGDGTSLSCPSPQFCMILTGDGDYATYTGTPLTPTPVPTVPATLAPYRSEPPASQAGS